MTTRRGSGPRGGLTSEERKARYWGPEHNRRRRKAYGSETAERARDAYRERAGVVVDDPRLRLDRLAEFGKVRMVSVAGKAEARVTFTVGELARFLGRTPTTLSHWRAAGLMPSPAHPYVLKRGGTHHAYLDVEVRAMAEILGEHFHASLLYGRGDIETRDALHKALGQKPISWK